MMAGLFVASVAGGALSDRFGARTTALGGLVLMIAGILWLTRLAAFLRPADAFGPVLLLGLALGVTWAPAQSSAMSAVDEARSGIAAGTTSACRYLGGAIGVLILAAYFNAAKAAPVDGARAHRVDVRRRHRALRDRLLRAPGQARTPQA